MTKFKFILSAMLLLGAMQIANAEDIKPLQDRVAQLDDELDKLSIDMEKLTLEINRSPEAATKDWVRDRQSQVTKLESDISKAITEKVEILTKLEEAKASVEKEMLQAAPEKQVQLKEEEAIVEKTVEKVKEVEAPMSNLQQDILAAKSKLKEVETVEKTGVVVKGKFNIESGKNYYISYRKVKGLAAGMPVNRKLVSAEEAKAIQQLYENEKTDHEGFKIQGFKIEEE